MALAAGCGGDGEASGPQSAAGTTSAENATRPSEPTNPGEAGGGDGAGGGGDESRSAAPRGAEEPDREANGAERGGEAAGEGEGGDAGEADGVAAEKAAFIRSANAVCARSKATTAKAMNTYMANHSDVPPAKRIEGALKEVYVPFMEARLAALRRLGAPPGDEAQVEAIWDAMEAWVEVARVEGVAAKAAIDRQLIQADTLAQRYGLSQCSSD